MKGGRTAKDRRKRRIEKLREEGRLEAHSVRSGGDRRDGTPLDHYEPKKHPQAIAIRKSAKSGLRPRQIAKRFGVGIDEVHRILDGRPGPIGGVSGTHRSGRKGSPADDGASS